MYSILAIDYNLHDAQCNVVSRRVESPLSLVVLSLFFIHDVANCIFIKKINGVRIFYT